MSLGSHSSCLGRCGVRHGTCPCCCRRTGPAGWSLGPAARPAGGCPTGLENERHRLLETNRGSGDEHTHTHTGLSTTADCGDNCVTFPYTTTRRKVLGYRLAHRTAAVPTASPRPPPSAGTGCRSPGCSCFGIGWPGSRLPSHSLEGLGRWGWTPGRSTQEFHWGQSEIRGDAVRVMVRVC